MSNLNISGSFSSSPATTDTESSIVNKPKKIELFSNQKVATDINAISSKYGSANFDDEREFTALGEYINKFKANLSSGVQRFLNGILNRTTSYTAEQIQEMASHTDKATKTRTENAVRDFAGTLNILDAIKNTPDIAELDLPISRAAADRAAYCISEFLEIIDPGTYNLCRALTSCNDPEKDDIVPPEK